MRHCQIKEKGISVFTVQFSQVMNLKKLIVGKN